MLHKALVLHQCRQLEIEMTLFASQLQDAASCVGFLPLHDPLLCIEAVAAQGKMEGWLFSASAEDEK